MFKKIINSFRSLPESNRSLVYLMWIYSFGTIIANVFVMIFIYKLNQSFNDLIIFNIIYFIFINIGFVGVGWIMSYFKMNIKNIFYLAYGSFVLSFILLLLFGNSLVGVFIYGALYGAGFGMFWCGAHTQVLKNIKDENRDFYSSMLSLGKNIMEIGVPLMISLIFLFGEKFNFDGYFILFLILPIVYLSSFIFINKVNDYTPSKIKKEDLKNFFNLKKYKYGHLFFLSGGLQVGVTMVIFPVLSLYMLKNEINIGIFQGLMAFLSTILIAHLSFKRNKDNRFKFFFISGSLYLLNFLIFFFNFNIYGFIIFTLANLFLMPLYKTGSQVYDISLIDNVKTETSDFYPAMILREFTLFIGRFIGLAIIFVIINSFSYDIESILRGGLLYIGLLFIPLVLSIYLWEKYEK